MRFFVLSEDPFSEKIISNGIFISWQILKILLADSKKISSSLNTGITTEKLLIMLFIFINITIHMEWMKIN